MNLTRLSAWMASSFAAQGTVLAMVVFILARNDHDMKLLALGAVIGQASSLMTTASTMIVGRQDKHDPSELPPGSVVKEASTVQTPPVNGPLG